jgi:hypothetical protein
MIFSPPWPHSCHRADLDDEALLVHRLEPVQGREAVAHSDSPKDAAAVAEMMEKAEVAGVEPLELAPLDRDQMPGRGLTHRANATPQGLNPSQSTAPSRGSLSPNPPNSWGYS